MIAWLGSKLIAAGALVVGVLALVATIWSRGRAAGATGERLKQAEAKDKLQEHYDEIGSTPRTFDDALGRLRDRSGGRR